MRILRSVPILAAIAAAPGAAWAQQGTNVGVTNTPLQPVADAGAEVNFDIVVVSTGPDDAVGVTLNDALASLIPVTFSQISGPAFDCTYTLDTNTITCTVDSMAV